MSIPEEMKAEIIKHVSADPKIAAEQMLRSVNTWVALLRLTGMPAAQLKQQQMGATEDFLNYFKAKVQEELLDQQRQTNDALAAALNMSAERKAEKK